MKGLGNLIIRNCKLFFKDKGMFFTSLITPMILLVLYATFLANVYEESFHSAVPEGFPVDERVIGGMVAGELISSLLAVSCVTVAFCSNMLMVRDKANGVRKDFLISPVSKGTLSLGYYVSTLISTLIISFAAAAVGILYMESKAEGFITSEDIFKIILDVIILVVFGTGLSSIVNIFLTSEGQISAVGTIVSAGYGFICGAYMPIASFSEGLRNVIGFLPGTYGTSLLRNHFLRGVFAEMENTSFPDEVIEGIKDGVDCNLYFFENPVSTGEMFTVITVSAFAAVAVYIILSALKKEKNK